MAIQLLLTKDVEDLGRSGDIVKVKNGYARNYILPQKLGVIASENSKNMQKRLQEERLKRAEQDKSEAEAMAKHFEGLILTTVVKVDHEGHMYGSVAAVDIVKMLQENANLHVEKRMVHLKHPIKAVGVHTIELKLKEGVAATFTLKVVAENQAEEAETPAPNA